MAINKQPVDSWTLVHLFGGMLASRAGLSFTHTMLLAVGWEILEVYLKKRYPQAFTHPSQDTAANMAGDVAAYAAGWVIVPKTLRGA